MKMLVLWLFCTPQAPLSTKSKKYNGLKKKLSRLNLQQEMYNVRSRLLSPVTAGQKYH